MLIAALFVASGTNYQQASKPYRDTSMNLTFQRPAEWNFKKSRYGEVFEFAVSDGTTAVVQIFKTKFRQPMATWQELQSEIVAQMGRKIAKQWEEQILGVPLLMTRSEYVEGGTEKATVAGLLYSATHEKLLFRISSTIGTIDQAESAWKHALLSLRTLSGDLPMTDDPTKPLVRADVNEKGQRISRLREEDLKQNVKPPNASTIFAFGRKVSVVLPKNWTIEQNGDDAILKSPSFLVPVELKIVPGGVPRAEAILSQENAASISRFRLVTLREEIGWTRNRVGAQTMTSTRIGSDVEGRPLNVLTIAGTNEGLIWHFQFLSEDTAAFSTSKKILTELAQILKLEFEA